MLTKIFRISLFLLVLAAIFLPSIARSSGLWVHEIYHFQQRLGGDKSTHFLAGAALQFGLVVLLWARLNWRWLALAFLLANLLMLGEEFSQYFIPSRHFEWSDLGWNFLGASTVCAVAALCLVVRRRRLRPYPEGEPSQL